MRFVAAEYWEMLPNNTTLYHAFLKNVNFFTIVLHTCLESMSLCFSFGHVLQNHYLC